MIKEGPRHDKPLWWDGTFAKGPPARRWRKKSDCPPEESADIQAIGRSRPGSPQSSWPWVDKTGRLFRFTIRPGTPRGTRAATLLDGVLTGELIADKAYDSDPYDCPSPRSAVVATIPSRVNRRSDWYDPTRYRTRHLVENYFCDLKHFLAVATRYNKLADSYRAMVNLASWIIETRSTRRTAKAPVYKQSARFPAYNTRLPLALVA